MKKSQAGFSLIESLLILVIVGLVSVVGWYVWNVKSSSNIRQNNGVNTTVTKLKPPSIPSGWLTYTSTHSSIQFSYPSNWKLTKPSDYTQPIKLPTAYELENITLTDPNNFVMYFILQTQHTLPPQNFMCTTFPEISVPINNEYTMILSGATEVSLKATNQKDLINTYCGRTLNAASSNTEFAFTGSYATNNATQTADTLLAQPEVQTAKQIFNTVRQ